MESEMLKCGPRYSKEEFARRGKELYETKVRPQVEAGNHGKIVAIDIETGMFEVGDTALAACERLYARREDAQPWCLRIGVGPVHRIRFLESSEDDLLSEYDPALIRNGMRGKYAGRY
jgi:hypothetical protein